MKYSELILLIGSLNGCAEPAPAPVKEDVATDYRCAANQLKRVRREVKDCTRSSESWRELCETAAMKKHCVRIPK